MSSWVWTTAATCTTAASTTGTAYYYSPWKQVHTKVCIDKHKCSKCWRDLLPLSVREDFHCEWEEWKFIWVKEEESTWPSYCNANNATTSGVRW